MFNFLSISLISYPSPSHHAGTLMYLATLSDFGDFIGGHQQLSELIKVAKSC